MIRLIHLVRFDLAISCSRDAAQSDCVLVPLHTSLKYLPAGLLVRWRSELTRSNIQSKHAITDVRCVW
jgi:hypothetical protein